MDAFFWFLTGFLILVGLAGTVLPLLPGTTLILGAMLIHKLALPEFLSWWMVGVLALVWGLSVLADLVGTLVGTRLGGGGRWALAGAATGSVAGLFISVPAVVLGSVLGAALAEKVGGGKTNDEAVRAGVGAGIGFVIGTVSKVVLACMMISLFILDCAL